MIIKSIIRCVIFVIATFSMCMTYADSCNTAQGYDNLKQYDLQKNSGRPIDFNRLSRENKLNMAKEYNRAFPDQFPFAIETRKNKFECHWGSDDFYGCEGETWLCGCSTASDNKGCWCQKKTC